MIATERLRLIPVAEADAAPLHGLLLPNEACWHPSDGAGLSRPAIGAMIGESLDPATATMYWRMAARESDFAGIIGLRPPSQASLRLRAIGWRSLEMIVALDPRLRGRGLASEAVEAIARHASQDGVTFALIGCVDIRNERSQRLLHRCGFQELGRADGPLHPLIVYERPL